MADTGQIHVEVAYARPDQQIILPLQVDIGTTLVDAIKLSGILARYPEIDLEQNKFGIFGKIAKADTELRERDRVEIYRVLIADPKESRRARAEKKQHQSESSHSED